MDAEAFYKQVISLPHTYPKRDLEEYLLALYKGVEAHKHLELTDELGLGLLMKAFEEEPLRFPEAWLSCIAPPDEYLLPDPEDTHKADDLETIAPYEYTREVIKFQIADLHKMRGKQLENEFRYFGLSSETGKRWYNFDPFTNLECGARCMLDTGFDFSTMDWSFIGVLLENGRMYE